MIINPIALKKYKRFYVEHENMALVPVRAGHLGELIAAYELSTVMRELIDEMLPAMDDYFMSQPIGQDIAERIAAISSLGKPDSSTPTL